MASSSRCLPAGPPTGPRRVGAPRGRAARRAPGDRGRRHRRARAGRRPRWASCAALRYALEGAAGGCCGCWRLRGRRPTGRAGRDGRVPILGARGPLHVRGASAAAARERGRRRGSSRAHAACLGPRAGHGRGGRVPEGATLAADGAIERRREPLDVGLERLRAAASVAGSERCARRCWTRCSPTVERRDDRPARRARAVDGHAAAPVVRRRPTSCGRARGDAHLARGGGGEQGDAELVVPPRASQRERGRYAYPPEVTDAAVEVALAREPGGADARRARP
jgi:hypothetical protein